MSNQDDLKQRLAAVLDDLKRDSGTDPEVVWTIGSLAAAVTDKAKAANWPALKDSLSREAYDRLLGDFQVQGNSLYQNGERRKAYAIQALGISLVCRTQRHDRAIRDGEALLDDMIQSAVGLYRKTQTH